MLGARGASKTESSCYLVPTVHTTARGDGQAAADAAEALEAVVAHMAVDSLEVRMHPRAAIHCKPLAPQHNALTHSG